MPLLRGSAAGSAGGAARRQVPGRGREGPRSGAGLPSRTAAVSEGLEGLQAVALLSQQQDATGASRLPQQLERHQRERMAQQGRTSGFASLSLVLTWHSDKWKHHVTKIMSGGRVGGPTPPTRPRGVGKLMWVEWANYPRSPTEAGPLSGYPTVGLPHPAHRELTHPGLTHPELSHPFPLGAGTRGAHVVGHGGMPTLRLAHP